MRNRILVPLDGSAFAELAVWPALRLAEKTNGQVCLLSVACAPNEAPFGGTHISAHPDNPRDYLDSLAARLRSATRSPISTAVRSGQAAEEILAEAATSGSFIVMTSHGRGGLSRFWLGSVADECVRAGSQPILLVRPSSASHSTSDSFQVAKVVVPLDGSPLAESCLPEASELAGLFDAPMVLVRSILNPIVLDVNHYPPTGWSALDPQQDVDAARAYLDSVADRMSRAGPRPAVHVTFGRHAAEAIREAAGRDGVVVMATHGLGGVSRALIGSVTDKVVRSAEGAVLVVPAGAEAWSISPERNRAAARA